MSSIYLKTLRSVLFHFCGRGEASFSWLWVARWNRLRSVDLTVESKGNSCLCRGQTNGATLETSGSGDERLNSSSRDSGKRLGPGPEGLGVEWTFWSLKIWPTPSYSLGHIYEYNCIVVKSFNLCTCDYYIKTYMNRSNFEWILFSLQFNIVIAPIIICIRVRS